MNNAETISKINDIRTDLNKRFKNRENVIDMMIASLVAGELMLLIGPRGEAKTAIVESFAGYISDGKHFSVGLAKSSTPDDILGGVDILALQNGIYRRNTEGFLPECTTFLLDEGFKCNNPTLQSLLRVLSEREFQGKKINALFGAIASNELPPELRGQKNGKSADLGPFEDSLLAFFDRFFYKVNVDKVINGTPDWQDIVFNNVTDTKANVSVTSEEILNLRNDIDNVNIDERTKNAIIELTIALETSDSNIRVSTRTWRKAVRMIKVHALLSGRNTVSRKDFRFLTNSFWTTPDQIPVIQQAIFGIGSRETAEAAALESAVSNYMTAYSNNKLVIDSSGNLQIDENSRNTNLNKATVQEPLIHFLRENINELRKLATSAEDYDEIDRVIAYVDKCRTHVVNQLMERLSVKTNNYSTKDQAF